MMSLDFSRGLFRIWVVLSISWIVFSLYIVDKNALFPKSIPADKISTAYTLAYNDWLSILERIEEYASPETEIDQILCNALPENKEQLTAPYIYQFESTRLKMIFINQILSNCKSYSVKFIYAGFPEYTTCINASAPIDFSSYLQNHRYDWLKNICITALMPPILILTAWQLVLWVGHGLKIKPK